VNSELEDIIDVFNRLQALQERQPPPLPLPRQPNPRDGPSEWCRPGLAPPTRSGAARHSQTYSSGISHRSRGMKP
jgi:hypothetical protein